VTGEPGFREFVQRPKQVPCGHEEKVGVDPKPHETTLAFGGPKERPIEHGLGDVALGFLNTTELELYTQAPSKRCVEQYLPVIDHSPTIRSYTR
jgi:hypothetical protein